MKLTSTSAAPAPATSRRSGWPSLQTVSDLADVACALRIYGRSGELYGDFVGFAERRLRYTVYSAGEGEPLTLLVVAADGFIGAVTLAHS